MPNSVSRRGRISRRAFMHTAAGLALAGTAAVNAGAQLPKSVVALIRDDNVLDAAGNVNAGVLSRMLDEAVVEVTGKPAAAAAWKSVIRPEDVVGIKTNVWQYLHVPPELEQAIRRRVVEAGVPEAKIAVDDTDARTNPGFQNATALVNVRPMRTHHWAGVGSCIKNYIIFAEEPWTWHADACANLAGVWNLPICKGKTRLNILVMLTPLFHGKGPHHFNKKYTWPYKGLIVGTDPVAVDATGLRILEARRRLFFKEDQPFSVPPHHIKVADEKYRLGNASPEKIDLRIKGWQDGILI